MTQVSNIYKYLKRNPSDFAGAHDVHTPELLVNELLDNIKLANLSILVLYNVEFLVSLVYTYKVNPENITFLADHPNKVKWAQRLGIACSIKKLDTKMNFDAVVGNPPYKQGLWRKLMEQALTLSNRYVAIISPDGTIQTSTKYNDTKKMLIEGGIQSVTPCHNHFPKVVTSSEIAYYIFDKALPANEQVFEKTLTNNEILTLSIINKIKVLTATSGGLIQTMKAGKKDSTANGKIATIKGVTKDGVNIVQQPKAETKVIVDSENYFFVNKFFGMNPDDTVHESTGAIGVIDDNVYYIGKPAGFNAAEFKRIYLSKLARFVLAHYRGTNTRTLGWSIRELPIIDATVTDLYSYAGLTTDEIAYVEANVK